MIYIENSNLHIFIHTDEVYLRFGSMHCTQTHSSTVVLYCCAQTHCILNNTYTLHYKVKCVLSRLAEKQIHDVT